MSLGGSHYNTTPPRILDVVGTGHELLPLEDIELHSQLVLCSYQRIPSLFRLFLGRDARTQLDATHPGMDGGYFRGGMHSYVADKRQAHKEARDVRAALLIIHEDRQKRR